jgi:hypothetical protein
MPFGETSITPKSRSGVVYTLKSSLKSLYNDPFKWYLNEFLLLFTLISNKLLFISINL